MEFGREKMKQIRGLMVLAALLILALIYSNTVFQGIAFFIGILSPFIIGSAIAFVLNLPMRSLEEKILARWNGKSAVKFKRPLCMVLSLLFVLLIFSIVAGTVFPQVTATATEIGKKIPGFMDEVVEKLDRLTKDYPELAEQVDKLDRLDIKWDSVMNTVIDFMKNGAGDVLNSTVNVATNIISGIVNGVISFIFALYILAQKERLANQGKRIISAYLPEAVGRKILEVCTLLHRNFSSFITGQCLEAVILGTLFVIAMSIFRMPYALMIGILIAFMSLIPIVGAFIGCTVGAFLILIDNPVQALWFIVLFLVIQQLEGNLIYPRVVGSSVGLPAIWVLMAVSVGGSLFGVVGMLMFIPLMSTAYALLRESVNNRNVGKALPVASTETGQRRQSWNSGKRRSRKPASDMQGRNAGNRQPSAGQKHGKNRAHNNQQDGDARKAQQGEERGK